jgi:hypothetical protein
MLIWICVWLCGFTFSSSFAILIDYSPHADALGCADLKHVSIGSSLYKTSRKELLRARLNGSIDVLVERPFDGASLWTQLNASVREAAYTDYFRRERVMMRSLASNFVPVFLGGCFTSFEVLLHVTEPLRLLSDVADDVLVDWRQRVRIAQNAVRLVPFLDQLPIGKRAIYGDTWTSHFGVDSQLRVKFLDYQSFFAYETRFGLYKCEDTPECHEKFFESDTNPKVLLGLRSLAPDDFRCVRGTCNGVDALTQLMAICKMLIEPLFADFDLPADAQAVHAILDACLQPKRVDRATPTAVAAALEKIVPARIVLRPLQIEFTV